MGMNWDTQRCTTFTILRTRGSGRQPKSECFDGHSRSPSVSTMLLWIVADEPVECVKTVHPRFIGPMARWPEDSFKDELRQRKLKGPSCEGGAASLGNDSSITIRASLLCFIDSPSRYPSLSLSLWGHALRITSDS